MGFYRNCCIAVGRNDMDRRTLAVVLLAAVAAVVQWMGRRRVNNLTMMVLTGAVASFSAADGEEVRDPAKKLWTYFYEKPKWHAFKSQSFDRQFNMHMHMPASAFNYFARFLLGIWIRRIPGFARQSRAMNGLRLVCICWPVR